MRNMLFRVACALSLLAGPDATAAPPVLNEYNAVSNSNYLNGGDAFMDEDGNGPPPADPYFGRVPGNGGDWFELVFVADGLDARGWQLEIVEEGDVVDVLVLSDASSSYAPYEPAPVTERMMDNAARRVIRECLPAVAGCPPAAAPMKVFVLVKVPTPETGGGKAEGFLPKRGFAPLLRQTKIAADFVMKVKRAEDDMVQGGGVVQGLPGMWYQCMSSVKGVKGPGS